MISRKPRTPLLNKLPSPDEILQGSLIEYRTTCTRSPGCRCHRGFKHGPYWYLSIHRRGKTRKVLIPKAKLPLVRRYLRNWKRFSKVLHAIMDTNIDRIKKEA